MKELWALLVSAQDSPNGIPQQFTERQKERVEATVRVLFEKFSLVLSIHILEVFIE